MTWNTLTTSAAPGDVISAAEQNKQAQNINHVVDDVYQRAVATSGLTLTTTYTDIPGVTLTLTKAGKFIITAHVNFGKDIVNDSGQVGFYRLVFDGSAQTGEPSVDFAGANSEFVSWEWSVTAATTAKVVKLQAKKSGGTGTSGIPHPQAMISARWYNPATS